MIARGGDNNGILLTGNNNEIYGHITSDDEAGPFQWVASYRKYDWSGGGRGFSCKRRG